MKIIPIKALPNQSLTFSNGDRRWLIEIKVAIDSMIVNLWLDNQPVLMGERIVAGVPFIPFPYLAFNGNFGIITNDDNEPWWQSFGVTQRLVFFND